MSGPPPAGIARVLDRGELCTVAAVTPRGLHVTPLVFVQSSGRLWLTTSRGSVKARAWRRLPAVAGLVRHGNRVVTFAGEVRTHDVLDPTGWVPSALAGPVVALASARFTRKNARFFAGYAVDAHRVPLAWTPPGRVFVEIRPRTAALLEGGSVLEAWDRSRRPARLEARRSFRATRTGDDPLEGLPPEVARRLGRSGVRAALAIEGSRGPAVLPAAWAAEGDALYAVLPARVLALAGPGPEAGATLMVDRASWWRARDMVGMMAPGGGEVFVPDALGSGRGSASAIVRGVGSAPKDAALVRVRPERLVWWRGWASGTVER